MRTACIALFAAIVILSVDPPLFVLALQDRAGRRELLTRRADPHPELVRFLEGVRAHTRRGDSIVLLLPVRDAERYSAAYFRASYHLAGRVVLPAIGEDGSIHRGNIAEAKYVAGWRVGYPGRIVWSGEGGLLVRAQ